MSAISLPDDLAGPRESEVSRLDGEMVELALLLPTWQADALASAAHDQGLTSAQMLRHLIRDYCDTMYGFQHLTPWRRSFGTAGPGV
jgi:hypothetical protein